MYEFKLPDIGEGLHEAELLQWDVKVGDTVAEGDSIAQVSTDKVNVELPSPRAGVVAELPWSPGDIVPVGEVLARIDDGKNQDASGPVEKEEKAQRVPKKEQVAERRRVKAAPAVRRYAAEKGVNLADVDGSGADSAVLREDIDRFIAGDGAGESGGNRVKLSGPRLAAAKRLEQSWRTLATSSMTFEVEADAILSECDRLAGEAGSTRVTPLAVISRCVCAALGDHPTFNAVIDDKARALEVHDAVHLGIAVDSPDGLLVPVLREAQQRTSLDLAEAIADRAAKARAGDLKVEDFRGSTFTISSTGSLEETTVTSTTPVINFPNVATLWVSRIRERPRVRDGKLGAGPMMSATLAFDHRFLHGADATRFINSLHDKLRKPE